MEGATEVSFDGEERQDDEQQQLDGTDHAKIKFVGMAWDTLEIPKLREEIEVGVRGIVVSHGEEIVNDSIRQIAKVKVTGIWPLEGRDDLGRDEDG